MPYSFTLKKVKGRFPDSSKLYFTLIMRIIPALDIIDGQCVRLTQGDYEAKKVYAVDPLEVAREFEAHGFRYLHLVDLDGAKAGHIVNWKVLEAICQHTQLAVDFGGGLQSEEDLRVAFESGARQITGGSIAVKNKELFVHWIATFGPERIILGADVWDERIAISGWKVLTDIHLFDFLAEYQQYGIQHVICTDIRKDGLLEGTSHELYVKIREAFPDLNLIASGGVSTVADVEQLNQIPVFGVIIGKALYEKRISYQALWPYLTNADFN